MKSCPGRTQDKNVAQVATWLNVQGIRLAEVRVVPDDRGSGSSRRSMRSGRATIICSPPAGSGRPMTTSRSMSIAAALGVPVVVHPEARAILEDYYRRQGRS